MVFLQSMWKGPNNCWNFMEFASESATFTFVPLYKNVMQKSNTLQKYFFIT